jgi:RNA-directed DNA polymerase
VRINEIDFASCFNLNNLMAASRQCERGVRWKKQPQQFSNKRLTSCTKLLEEIEGGSYAPQGVKPFTICERGKTRHVKPVTFRDRVAQRCFCNHVLVPAVEGYVTDECSAVLPGRGLSYAFEHVRKIAETAPFDAWVARFDFSDYFATIDHAVLLNMLSRLIPDDRLYSFARTVVDSEGPGLDLGSHISQLCATMYPTPIDRAVMDLEGTIGYHRYMDDGIMVCASRKDADAALDAAVSMATRMRLTINPRKTFINRVAHPFVFCKMRFTKRPDGSVRCNVRKQQSRRAVKHAKSVVRLAKRTGCIDLEPVAASLSGYLNRGDVDLTWLAEKAMRQ